MLSAPRTIEDAMVRLVASVVFMFVSLSLVPSDSGTVGHIVSFFVITAFLGYGVWASISYVRYSRRRQKAAQHNVYVGVGGLDVSSLSATPLDTRSDASAIMWYAMFGMGVFLALLAVISLGLDTHPPNVRLLLSGILLAIATTGVVGGIKAWRRPKNPARAVDLRRFAADNGFQYETDMSAQTLKQAGAGRLHAHMLDRAYFSVSLSGVYRGRRIAISNIGYRGYEGFIGNLMKPGRVYIPYMTVTIEVLGQTDIHEEQASDIVGSYGVAGGVLSAGSTVIIHRPTGVPYDRFGMSELVDTIDKIIDITE